MWNIWQIPKANYDFLVCITTLLLFNWLAYNARCNFILLFPQAALSEIKTVQILEKKCHVNNKTLWYNQKVQLALSQENSKGTINLLTLPESTDSLLLEVTNTYFLAHTE